MEYMNNNKHESLDKKISMEIMKEVRGKIIEHVCPWCKGLDKGCQDCSGEGKYKIQY